jgi:membrane-associated protease RseP (regulator of RpoE activity)
VRNRKKYCFCRVPHASRIFLYTVGSRVWQARHTRHADRADLNGLVPLAIWFHGLVLLTARNRMRSMPIVQISTPRLLVSKAFGGVDRLAVLAIIAVILCIDTVAGPIESAPGADTALPEPASAPAETAAPAFKPEDISIGEPISLPFATPLASPAPDRPATSGRGPVPPAAAPAGMSSPTPAAQLPSVVAPATPAAAFQPRQAIAPAIGQAPADAGGSLDSAAAGTGWLGIAVDDTVVTGRLVVVEVAPDGPAAKAGVRPQDMLLAINGNHLQNGDELAAALAAIVPGQRVKMAVGRDNRVEDVVAQASARPAAALSRDWQSATSSQNTPPTASVAISPAALPDLVSPTRLVPETAAIGVLPAPAAAAPVPMTPGGRTALGVRTVPVDPNVQTRFRLSEAQGAFVIGVVQDLPASKAGVPPGSVIVAINHQPVRSPQDLTHLVARGPVGTPVPLQYVLPGGESKQADVVLQSLEQPLERALIGSGETGQTAEPPSLQPAPLQPAPLTTRRVQPTAGYQSEEPASLGRLEELLRRMNNRLEQIERRLERIESGR